MHSIVIAPGLAKSLSRVLDLWDNLRLTYTLITTNSENRVEQHLKICHQPGHGYHIYLISIDCLNYLYRLFDLTRTYFYRKRESLYSLSLKFEVKGVLPVDLWYQCCLFLFQWGFSITFTLSFYIMTFFNHLYVIVPILSEHTLLRYSSINPWYFSKKTAEWVISKLSRQIDIGVTYLWILVRTYTNIKLSLLFKI